MVFLSARGLRGGSPRRMVAPRGARGQVFGTLRGALDEGVERRAVERGVAGRVRVRQGFEVAPPGARAQRLLKFLGGLNFGSGVVVFARRAGVGEESARAEAGRQLFRAFVRPLAFRAEEGERSYEDQEDR